MREQRRASRRRTDGRRRRASILLVAHADHRFANMTVNQRARALADVAAVRIVACHPWSFPQDVRSRAAIRGLPISSRLRTKPWAMAVFSAEVAVWALLQRGACRRYELVYSFQDTSAVAGLILRSCRTGWVMDAVDDPAMELSNARRRGKRVKAGFLRARDHAVRALIRRADLVPTIGGAPHDPLPIMLQEHYGVPSSKILVLNQAIDVASVGAGSPSTAPPSPARVLFVGFVSPLRGVHTVMEAARALWRQGIDLQVRLLGHLKREDESWLAEFLEEGPHRARYLGTLPSSRTLREMRDASVGVLPFPATREMAPVQPVTGLEYLALGKPLVGTRLPGMASLIEDGVNGYLVDPGDADAMAEAIARVTTDPGLAQRFGEASRARAERFDVSRVNDRLFGALAGWL
jgi:glycosyltransferase involved in cell wall biosynthesis